jgi:hypothetical protein
LFTEEQTGVTTHLQPIENNNCGYIQQPMYLPSIEDSCFGNWSKICVQNSNQSYQIPIMELMNDENNNMMSSY